MRYSDVDSKKIYMFNETGKEEPLHCFEKLRTQPVVIMKFNPVYEIAVSADQAGMIEYWTGAKYDYQFPRKVKFESLLDTDLYEFFKCKTHPAGLCFNKQGTKFATISLDRKVKVFKFLIGKLLRVIDEILPIYSEMQQKKKQKIPSMEFVRRMAGERELEKTGTLNFCNILFDESGYFLLFPTKRGVKIVNLYTNQLTKIIGKPENLRIFSLHKLVKKKGPLQVEWVWPISCFLDGLSSLYRTICRLMGNADKEQI